MLIYGDPQFEVEFRDFVEALRSNWKKTAHSSLHGLRPILIRVGQLEQGLADSADAASSSVKIVSTLLETLASEFYRLWRNPRSLGNPMVVLEVERDFELLRREPDTTVRIKVPEGFEFYSLFPEQYCLAAERWCVRNAAGRRRTALVVGIRSIGTTLSAVVAATLRAHGWQVHRRTVRPTGHPFFRECSLEVNVASFSRALVVDEGPGLSGSSMASVAQALVAAGARETALFPGHSGMPGPSASPDVLHTWRTLPRFVALPEEVRWMGSSLHDTLADAARRLNGDSSLSTIVDVSAGRWRERAEIPHSRWPAVAPAFEAGKLLVESPTRPLLWKFVGLGSARQPPGLESFSSRSPFGLSSVGFSLGYAAFPWIRGPRASPGRQPPPVLDTLATHLVESAGPPMSHTGHGEALARLTEMLYHNTRETLGQAAASHAQACAQAASRQDPGPTYSDGRMGPWEWILTEAGLVKADSTGDTVDHTLIGSQSILWDVAATIVEWDLPSDQAASFANSIQQHLGLGGGALDFYCLAWCAYRIGLFTMALSNGLDAEEASRAAATVDQLKEKLRAALAEPV